MKKVIEEVSNCAQVVEERREYYQAKYEMAVSASASEKYHDILDALEKSLSFLNAIKSSMEEL